MRFLKRLAAAMAVAVLEIVALMIGARFGDGAIGPTLDVPLTPLDQGHGADGQH